MGGLTRKAAIAGVHEYPSRRDPTVSENAIQALSAKRALEDAGLEIKDVDGLMSPVGMGLLQVAEYMGLNPDLVDSTQVGGSSYQFARRPGYRGHRRGSGQLRCRHLRQHRALQRPRHRDRRPQHGQPQPHRELRGPLRRHPRRYVRHGEEPPHVRVRHQGRAVRQHLGHHPPPRRLEPRGDVPRPHHHRRRPQLAHHRLPAAPPRVLHRQRWRRRRRRRQPRAGPLHQEEARLGARRGRRLRPPRQRQARLGHHRRGPSPARRPSLRPASPTPTSITP